MKQKIGVVTGGANGIGKATCKLLIEKDYKVVLSDINEKEGLSTTQELIAAGGDIIFCKADVSKFKEVETLIDNTVKEQGSINLLVNNAGIGADKYQKTADHSLDDWDKVIAVNQSGVFYGMKVALGYMEKQGYGNIVNVSSLAGIKGSTTGMSYSASKFAVVGMTKSAALEYAKMNIRINCVCPAFTETHLLNKSLFGNEDVKKKLIKTVPVKRFANPEEIAQSIVWLASSQSSYITGHALVVDGGLSI